MLSLGMLCARAISITLRKRALPAGAPAPIRAATLISLENLLKSVPRLTSSAPLMRLTFDHLLCPALEWGKKGRLPGRPVLRGKRNPGSLERRSIEEANLIRLNRNAS